MPITGGADAPVPTVYVAGGGGFLGRATCAQLLKRRWRVVSLGIGTPDSIPDIAGHVEGLITRDTLDAATDQFGPPDVVIQAAGGASVGRSWESPRSDFEMSVLSTVEILDYLRDAAPDARLVYVSSAAVYGEQKAATLDEDAPRAPVSPYGAHKLMCEELAAAHSRMHGAGVIVVRFFSLYGDGLRKQLIWDLLRRAEKLPEGAALELNGDGDEERDFLHVDDAARVLQRAAESAQKGEFLALNGATGNAVTVRELAVAALRATGDSRPVSFNGEKRAGDPRRLVGSPDRLGRHLGFKAGITLEQGLQRYAAWYRAASGHNRPGQNDESTPK